MDGVAIGGALSVFRLHDETNTAARPTPAHAAIRISRDIIGATC
jgi:hypothetical protein